MFIELNCMDDETGEYEPALINMDYVTNCKKNPDDGGTILFNTLSRPSNSYFQAKESFEEIMQLIKEAS